jgi:hypothetical protein
MKSRPRLPRPAFVIACIALLFSVGGSAYAVAMAPPNSVTSASIQDGQVRSRDVLNRTIKGLDVADHSLGPRVFGESSVGNEALAGFQVVSASSPATADADGSTNAGMFGVAKATAVCPVGTRFVSGTSRWVSNTGNGADDSAVYVQEQFAEGNAWTVEGIVDFGAQGTIRLQAQAYCLAAGGVIVP